MLGENAIRIPNPTVPALARIADRIGPTISDVTGVERELDPRLVGHLHHRGGCIKPAEGDSKITEIDAMLQADPQLRGWDDLSSGPRTPRPGQPGRASLTRSR